MCSMEQKKHHRMCSLTIKCALLLSTAFSYNRMCSLTDGADAHGAEDVVARRSYLQSVGRSYVSGTIECVLLQ